MLRCANRQLSSWLYLAMATQVALFVQRLSERRMWPAKSWRREISPTVTNQLLFVDHLHFPYEMLLPLSVLFLVIASAGTVKEEVIRSFSTNLDTPLSLLTHDEIVTVFDVSVFWTGWLRRMRKNVFRIRVNGRIPSTFITSQWRKVTQCWTLRSKSSR